jgi:hypothetical protein
MKIKRKILALAVIGIVFIPNDIFYNVNNLNSSSTQQVNEDGKKASVFVDGYILSRPNVEKRKISVTLPTHIAFVVMENGDFLGTMMTIKSESSVKVKLSVDDFEVINAANVKLLPQSQLKREDLNTRPRKELSLYLQTVDEPLPVTLDLGDREQIKLHKTLVELDKEDTARIKLDGYAGRDLSNCIDKDGAKILYKIIFKISTN